MAFVVIFLPVSSRISGEMSPEEIKTYVRGLLPQLGLRKRDQKDLDAVLDVSMDDVMFGFDSKVGLTARHIHLARDIQLALRGEEPKVPDVLESDVSISVYSDKDDCDDDEAPLLLLRWNCMALHAGGDVSTVWMIPNDEEQL